MPDSQLETVTIQPDQPNIPRQTVCDASSNYETFHKPIRKESYFDRLEARLC